MKTKIISILLFACSLASAQAPCNISGSFTSATSSATFDNRKLGCYNWRVSYNNTGFSAVSIQLEQAPDTSGTPGTWAAFGSTVVIDGANPSTNTNAAIIGIHSGAAWVRLRLASVTGSGTVTYQVWGANNQSNFALYGTSPIQVNGGNVSCPSCGSTLQTAKYQAGFQILTTTPLNATQYGLPIGSLLFVNSTTGGPGLRSIFIPSTCTLRQVNIISDVGPGGAGNATTYTLSLLAATITPGTPVTFSAVDANTTVSVTGATPFNSVITNFAGAATITGPALMAWQFNNNGVTATNLVNLGVVVICS